MQPDVSAWPLKSPTPRGGSGQDSSQTTHGTVGGQKDVPVRVDLKLQRVTEVILHKNALGLVQGEA